MNAVSATHSVERNLLLASERCFGNAQRRAEPPARLLPFSAKERDPETGLSNFGSRHYSIDLSVWLSVDPMADEYPSLAPYMYCADNPAYLAAHNNAAPFENEMRCFSRQAYNSWKQLYFHGKYLYLSNSVNKILNYPFKSCKKNGVIICVNLRGLRDNYMPAKLAEIRRQDIHKIQGDNSEKILFGVNGKHQRVVLSIPRLVSAEVLPAISIKSIMNQLRTAGQLVFFVFSHRQFNTAKSAN